MRAAVREAIERNKKLVEALAAPACAEALEADARASLTTAASADLLCLCVSYYVLRHKSFCLSHEMLSELGLPGVATGTSDTPSWRAACVRYPRNPRCVAFRVAAFVSQNVGHLGFVEFLKGRMLTRDPLADEAPACPFKHKLLQYIDRELMPSVAPGARLPDY